MYGCYLTKQAAMSDQENVVMPFIEVPNADFQILHVARARVNGTGSAHAPH